MSLDNYSVLQKEPAEKIGIKLPLLKASNFDREAEVVNLENTLALIKNFQADSGWVMKSDEVNIQSDGTGISDDSPIIEAQFNKGNTSLHIKLVNNGQYNVAKLTSESSDENQKHSSAYSEQELYVRNNLAEQSGNNVARYRLWWQQESSGINEGRWKIIAQQFMGFSTEPLASSKKENAS